MKNNIKNKVMIILMVSTLPLGSALAMELFEKDIIAQEAATAAREAQEAVTEVREAQAAQAGRIVAIESKAQGSASLAETIRKRGGVVAEEAADDRAAVAKAAKAASDYLNADAAAKEAEIKAVNKANMDAAAKDAFNEHMIHQILHHHAAALKAAHDAATAADEF